MVMFPDSELDGLKSSIYSNCSLLREYADPTFEPKSNDKYVDCKSLDLKITNLLS